MTPLLFLLLGQPAMAGKIRTPDVVEEALAFAEVDRAKAITLLEGAHGDAKKKEGPVIALYAAEQRRLAGDHELAHGWFERASEDKALVDAVALGRVLLAVDQGLTPEQIAVLGETADKVAIDSQNADRYLLLALMAAKQNEASQVKMFSKKALAFAESDPEQLQRITERLQDLAGKAPDEVSVTSEGGGTDLERAREALLRGDRERAAKLAQKALDEADMDTPEHAAAEWTLKRAQSTAALQPNRIAVLLPRSERFALVGQQIEEALRWGYQAEGGKAELVFLDTKGTPEGAVAALEDAVLQQGVIAVVGPLLSEAAPAVVEAAQGLQIPLLSLSQSNEVGDDAWVYQGVPTVGDQAEALAEHMITVDQAKRFGIFAPDSAGGHRAAEAFKAAVLARGGEIAGETFYDPEAKALMPFAAELGQKDEKARAWELRKLREEAEEAGRDPGTVVLPPAVEFDAIFIPDNARNVALAAAALAYEEFSIGQFRAKKGADTAALIGLSGWNHQTLVTSGDAYVRDSRFTEYFLTDAHPDFVRDFKGATNRDPSPLEAAVVDAGRLLAKAAGTDHASFAESLAAAKVEGSNTGTTGFGEDHRSTPTIAILTIDRDGILPVE